MAQEVVFNRAPDLACTRGRIACHPVCHALPPPIDLLAASLPSCLGPPAAGLGRRFGRKWHTHRPAPTHSQPPLADARVSPSTPFPSAELGRTLGESPARGRPALRCSARKSVPIPWARSGRDVTWG
ncbi:hypothetical protein GQ53DRAFT_741209 [Thozetella sp. PMI_491]|nr:hypothetical protein GQ53DRAFT_741209 [Thozetella sp. PMI_491]